MRPGACRETAFTLVLANRPTDRAASRPGATAEGCAKVSDAAIEPVPSSVRRAHAVFNWFTPVDRQRRPDPALSQMDSPGSSVSMRAGRACFPLAPEVAPASV